MAVGGRDASTGESIGWIWNLAPAPGKPPRLHATVRGHGLGGINSISFLPDDDRLLTGGTDGTARLWDWQKDAALEETDPPLAADFLISLVRRDEATTHRARSHPFESLAPATWSPRVLTAPCSSGRSDHRVKSIY